MRYAKDIALFVRNKSAFIGIDVHLDSWSMCIHCDGEVVETSHITSDYSRLKNLLKGYASAREIRLVYEAGLSGFWLYRRLSADGVVERVTI